MTDNNNTDSTDLPSPAEIADTVREIHGAMDEYLEWSLGMIRFLEQEIELVIERDGPGTETEKELTLLMSFVHTVYRRLQEGHEQSLQPPS